MFGFFFSRILPFKKALKTLGPTIINIYHSHILPSIILPNGMKFCYPPAENDLFIYMNPGATVGDNIYASSTLAVTFDPSAMMSSEVYVLHRLKEE